MTRPFRQGWLNVPRRCVLWRLGAPTPARSQEFGPRRGNTVGGKGRRLGGCQSGEPKRLGLRDAEPQPCGGGQRRTEADTGINTNKARPSEVRAAALPERSPPGPARRLAHYCAGAPTRPTGSLPGPAPPRRDCPPAAKPLRARLLPRPPSPSCGKGREQALGLPGSGGRARRRELTVVLSAQLGIGRGSRTCQGRVLRRSRPQR